MAICHLKRVAADMKDAGHRITEELYSPTGRLSGVEFIQNRLGGWRAGGRRLAIPIEGSEFIEPCDTLIVAIGRQTLNDYLDVKVDAWLMGRPRRCEAAPTTSSRARRWRPRR